MTVLAHAGTEEITYVFLPAAIFFIVYRLVRGKPEPPEQSPDGDSAERPTHP